MRKVKVGIDVRDLQIAKTGSRTYLMELITALKNHPDKNVQYLLLNPDIRVFKGENKFLKLIEHISFFLWKQIFLPFKAKVKGCDILICTDYFVPIINLNIKTIPIFHDAFFYEYPSHYNKYWLFLFKKLAIAGARKSDIIITPTQYAKAQIAKYTKLDSSKIIVIYEAGKTLNRDDLQSAIALPQNFQMQSYLLHVGTMEIRKNIPFLLRAFKILKNSFPDLKLVLVGQFSDKSNLDDKKLILNTIQHLKLEDEVILSGYIPDEHLSWYYKNALLYIFPSLNEGFGIPILESFSNGLAVLAANNTCLPEIGGDAAFYFDPKDERDLVEKVKLLILDRDLRNKLIQNGYKRNKLFTWANTADAYVKQFYYILKK